MKIAIIGSRGLHVNDLERYLPENVTEIVSGGARGIDSDARAYAQAHGIPLKEFLPDYERFGRSAHGAGAGASAAGDALFSIDFVLAIAFADRANGAFAFAGTAHDAFVADLISHSIRIKVLIAPYVRILSRQISVSQHKPVRDIDFIGAGPICSDPDGNNGCRSAGFPGRTSARPPSAPGSPGP